MNFKPVSDEPIKSFEEDELYFCDYAKSVANCISKLDNTFVIGIDGEWGSGKTSIINLVLDHLTKQGWFKNNKKIFIDPWMFLNSEDIVFAFLTRLYNAHSVKENKMFFKKVHDMISPSASLLGKFLKATSASAGGFALDFDKLAENLSNSLEELKEKYISKSNKQNFKILVIIDDLDRLTNDEIRVVFKMLKTVGSLPNVVYLLAFSSQIVKKAFKGFYDSDKEISNKFLEKIVQVIYPIPKRDSIYLKNMFLKRMRNITEQHNEVDYLHDLKELEILWDEKLHSILTTPRSLNLLYNSIIFQYSHIKHMVYFNDFLLLEILRLWFNDIYMFIYNSHSVLTEIMYDFEKGFYVSEDKIKQKQQTYIDLTSDKEGIDWFVNFLFPRSKVIKSKILKHADKGSFVYRRIQSTMFFKNYFSFLKSFDIMSLEQITPIINKIGTFDAFRNDVHSLNKLDFVAFVNYLQSDYVTNKDNITASNVETIIKTLVNIDETANFTSNDDWFGGAIWEIEAAIGSLLRALLYKNDDWRVTPHTSDAVKKTVNDIVIKTICKGNSIHNIVSLLMSWDEFDIQVGSLDEYKQIVVENFKHKLKDHSFDSFDYIRIFHNVGKWENKRNSMLKAGYEFFVKYIALEKDRIIDFLKKCTTTSSKGKPDISMESLNNVFNIKHIFNTVTKLRKSKDNNNEEIELLNLFIDSFNTYQNSKTNTTM